MKMGESSVAKHHGLLDRLMSTSILGGGHHETKVWSAQYQTKRKPASEPQGRVSRWHMLLSIVAVGLAMFLTVMVANKDNNINIDKINDTAPSVRQKQHDGEANVDYMKRGTKPSTTIVQNRDHCDKDEDFFRNKSRTESNGKREGLSKKTRSCSKLNSKRDVTILQNFVKHVEQTSGGRKKPFEQIQTFIMFFGFGRSGHSWIGSVLDAAPNAVIANEWDVMGQVVQEEAQDSTVSGHDVSNTVPPFMSTNELYRELIRNTYLCGLFGRKQAYDYSIPGLFQGKFDPDVPVTVIGDKKGGTALRYFRSIGEKKDHAWLNDTIAAQNQNLFHKVLNKTLGGSESRQLRIVVVYRNPFDMIATKSIRRRRGSSIDKVTTDVLEAYLWLFWAKKNLGVSPADNDRYSQDDASWYIMTMEDFAHDTERELERLCDFTKVDCHADPNYISAVVNQTHHKVHRSRHLVPWDKSQVERVSQFISKYLVDFYSPCFYG